MEVFASLEDSPPISISLISSSFQRDAMRQMGVLWPALYSFLQRFVLRVQILWIVWLFRYGIDRICNVGRICRVGKIDTGWFLKYVRVGATFYLIDLVMKRIIQ